MNPIPYLSTIKKTTDMKNYFFTLIAISLVICSCSNDSKNEQKGKTKIDKKNEAHSIQLPNASTDSLEVEKLLLFSNDTLQQLMNDIYANHNYIFKSEALTEHYSKLENYTPENKNVEQLLSDLEKGNLKTIRVVQSLRQTNYGSVTVVHNGHYMHFKDWYFENHPNSALLNIKDDWQDTLRNPKMEATKPSYFTEYNLKNSFVFLAPLYRGDIMIPDCNSDLLNFALTNLEEDQFKVERPVINGEGTYSNYNWNLTTVRFDNEYPLTIVADDQVIETKLDTWGLDSEHECPGDRPYMRLDSIKLQKYRDYTDPWEDDNFHQKNMEPTFAFGLIDLIGFENDWSKKIQPKRSESSIKSTSGKTYKGTSVDLNNDGIADLFWYNQLPENEYETHRTTRLYVNLDGSWVLRYIDDFKGCY